MQSYKDELGHHYRDFEVIAITDERIPSNGCIKWQCECVRCGYRKTISGNALRFGAIKGVCPVCGSRKKRK